MRFQSKLALLAGALVLVVAPTVAVAAVPDNQGTAHKPATPGPSAGLPAKAKAYGRYCQDESKKHVKGEKGTPFSQCVTAMAKLANGQAENPRSACEGLSKKHVKGEKGTPFSQCVSGGAKLLREQTGQSSS
jgi:hypothetical protein